MLNSQCFPYVCGIIASAFIPPIHITILYHFWKNYSRNVDQRFCSCSCWDTVFKGTYETGVASYKHLYFNATINSMKIWILVVSGVIALHESVKHLYKLASKKKLRISMLYLFLFSIFPHYYSWWAYINYYNDDYYDQWSHQLFFTVSQSFILIV